MKKKASGIPIPKKLKSSLKMPAIGVKISIKPAKIKSGDGKKGIVLIRPSKAKPKALTMYKKKLKSAKLA